MEAAPSFAAALTARIETASTPCSANRRSAILMRRLRVSLPCLLRNDVDTCPEGIRSHGVQPGADKGHELVDVAVRVGVLPVVDLAEHLDQCLRGQRPAHPQDTWIDAGKRPGHLLQQAGLD